MLCIQDTLLPHVHAFLTHEAFVSRHQHYRWPVILLTQWRRSGYKLCIMCPEGEEPARRWRASLSGVTLGALQWTMSHPPQLRRSPWQVLLLINRETHLPHLGVTRTCAVAACLSASVSMSVHIWARTLNDKEATPLSEYSRACIHSSLLQRFRVRFSAFSGNNV